MHEQVFLRFCWGSACWVRYLGGEHALDADERIQLQYTYSDACAAENFCFYGGVGMLRSAVATERISTSGYWILKYAKASL
jgi:hypothetical protein